MDPEGTHEKKRKDRVAPAERVDLSAEVGRGPRGQGRKAKPAFPLVSPSVMGVTD